MNGYPLRLELKKIRRLNGVTIAATLVVAVALLSSVSLFSQTAQESFDDPATDPWPALLLTYTLMAAIGSPLKTALLASRVVDIEHAGGGWFLMATAGYSRGALCRTKLVAITAILAPATAVQTALVLGLGGAAGIRTPLDVTPWIGYTVFLVVVDVVFTGLHVLLSAIVPNQLVAVGVGLLGAFLAVFSLLSSPVVARVLPWGYYAVISFARSADDGAAYTQPPYLWVAGFVVVAVACFTLGIRTLDRMEA